MEVKNWSLVLGKANIKNLLLIPIKFSVGRISFYPKWFYYAISAGWSLFLFIQILNFKNKRLRAEIKNDKLKLLYPLFFIPVFFGFFVSFFAPLLQYFRFLYLLPIFCLLIALSLSTAILGRSAAVVFLVFSCLYLFIPNFHREDWKNLVRFLPKDKKIYMIKEVSEPIKYYRPHLKIFPIEKLDIVEEKKIVVIPYASEIWGLDYQSILSKRSYLLKKTKNFRGVSYEIYEK